MIQPPRLPVYVDPARAELTPREMQVLLGACQGWCDKDIAVEMRISPDTVRHMFRSVRLKLSVDNRTAAVLEAIKRGWFSP